MLIIKGGKKKMRK